MGVRKSKGPWAETFPRTPSPSPTAALVVWGGGRGEALA